MASKPHDLLLLFTPHRSYHYRWTAHCSCGWKLCGPKPYVRVQHELHGLSAMQAEKDRKRKLDQKLYERKRDVRSRGRSEPEAGHVAGTSLDVP